MKLCFLFFVWIVLMTANPCFLPFSISSLDKSSATGNMTVGNVRKHSARDLSLLSACNAKLIVSTAVRTMPLDSKSLSKRLLFELNYFCLVSCALFLL